MQKQTIKEGMSVLTSSGAVFVSVRRSTTHSRIWEGTLEQKGDIPGRADIQDKRRVGSVYKFSEDAVDLAALPNEFLVLMMGR